MAVSSRGVKRVAANSVHSLYECLRGEAQTDFERSIERWRRALPSEQHWRSDWESATSPEALVRVFALTASRPELIGALCQWCKPLVSGRAPIVELEPALDSATGFSIGALASATLDGSLSSLRAAAVGSSKSSRRRYAFAAVEDVLRAAITVNRPGKVRYEGYAQNAVLCLVYASSTAANRDERFEKMCASIRETVTCPALDVVLRELEVRSSS